MRRDAIAAHLRPVRIVHAYPNLIDAQLAKLSLESEGIAADILDEATATLAPHLTFASGIRLAVADGDFARAREALGLPPVEMPPAKVSRGVPWWAFAILAVAVVSLFLKAKPASGTSGDDPYSIDRNGDGKADERYDFDASGKVSVIWCDNNFDGRWDERFDFKNGVAARIERDLDFDGAFDEVTELRHGVPLTSVVRKGGKGPVLLMTTYRDGVVAQALEDADGDGSWDFRTVYDAFGRVTGREDLGVKEPPSP